MRPVVYTLSNAAAGTLTSNVYPPDNYVSPFNIALNVAVTGNATYTVQYTFDNVFAANFAAANATWNNHPTLTAQTTSKDSNISYPVTGIRVQQSAGNGSIVFTMIQAGGGGLA